MPPFRAADELCPGTRFAWNQEVRHARRAGLRGAYPAHSRAAEYRPEGEPSGILF
jgi:hypothetical protein